MKRTVRAPLPGGFREMLAIALPMVASHGCETALIFTDRLFLSRLSPTAMNASMGGGLSSFMLMTFFIGLVGYVTALSAQYLGAGQPRQCSRVVFQAAIISLIAAPLLLFFRPLVHKLFILTGVPAEQLPLQIVYFNLLVYGAMPALLRTCLSSFFSGIGKTRIVLFATFITMLLNIFFNYCLIFGHLGLPALGLKGAAYGTLASSSCGLLILLFAYFSRHNRNSYRISESFHLDVELLKKLLRYGSPSGLEMFLNLLAFNIVILIFHSDGPVTATAVTIVFNWDLVSFVPLLGIQVGVVSLVGRYMGAGQVETAARATMSALKMAFGYSLLILILFASIPDLLVNVFKPDDVAPLFVSAFPLAATMLRLAAFYVLADAIMVVFSGALRGAGDTFWTMLISVCMHWLLIPLLLISLKTLNLNPLNAWILLICVFMTFSAIFYLRYHKGTWKKIRVIEPPFHG